MIWHLVFTLLLSGQQVELIDTRRFDTLAACNTELAKFAELRTPHAWAVTCVSEIKA
jgi:hypothetical protein